VVFEDIKMTNKSAKKRKPLTQNATLFIRAENHTDSYTVTTRFSRKKEKEHYIAAGHSPMNVFIVVNHQRMN